MRKVIAALLVALSVLPLAAVSVSVQGNHTVYMQPDIAVFSVSASALDDTTKAAMQKTSDMISGAVAILSDYGIETKDISTSYINVAPDYSWVDGEQVFRGQKAEQSISVTLHDIGLIGDIYGSLMAVDGISVSSPTLDKEDKTAEYREARMGAVLDAYLKAEAYANAAGYAIGNLVSLSDGGVYTPMYARASNVMLAAAAVDIAEGATAEFYLDNIAVSSTVSVQWEIEKLSGTPWVVTQAAVR